MEYHCEICDGKILEDEYRDNDGLCDVCRDEEDRLAQEFEDQT